MLLRETSSVFIGPVLFREGGLWGIAVALDLPMQSVIERLSFGDEKGPVVPIFGCSYHESRIIGFVLFLSHSPSAPCFPHFDSES